MEQVASPKILDPVFVELDLRVAGLERRLRRSRIAGVTVALALAAAGFLTARQLAQPAPRPRFIELASGDATLRLEPGKLEISNGRESIDVTATEILIGGDGALASLEAGKLFVSRGDQRSSLEPGLFVLDGPDGRRIELDTVDPDAVQLRVEAGAHDHAGATIWVEPGRDATVHVNARRDNELGASATLAADPDGAIVQVKHGRAEKSLEAQAKGVTP